VTLKKILVPKIEFYITNVCNLSCEQCNRFNNHAFRGQQNWQDYSEIYKQWSEVIDIGQIVVLGGEPLLNPSIIEWVKGINQLWNRPVQILSNGTRINQVHGLYDVIQHTNIPIDDTYHANMLGISLHDANTLPELDDSIREFLKGNVKRFSRDVPWVTNSYGHAVGFVYVDSNQVRIPVWIQDSFNNAALQLTQEGKFTLHQSDPNIAHGICGFAIEKCYHFIKGKLYKCGPVALFPEFDQQHTLDISDEDRILINSYQPLSVDEFQNRGSEFLKNIDNAIPQCKFCPVTLDNKKITAFRKNSKILDKIS